MTNRIATLNRVALETGGLVAQMNQAFGQLGRGLLRLQEAVARFRLLA